MTRPTGPQLPFSDELHAGKYRSEGEGFREAMNRVANGLKDDDAHFHALRDVLLDMRFMPAGRIQSAIGSGKNTTPYNCLSGDTEVLTARGFVRLEDYEGRALDVLSPVSGRLEPAVFKSYGEQELFDVKVSYSSGGQERSGSFVVRATANHRWVLQDGAVVEGVRVGQLLKSASSEVDTDACGWAHGFVFGDGSMQRPGKYGVRLCGAKARHLPRLLSAYQSARVTYPQSLEGDPYVTLEADVALKELPPVSASAEYLRGFVEGLLAADGCFSTRGNDPFQFHGPRHLVEWVRDHLALADYAPCGRAHECASGASNFGERSEPLWKVHFRRASDHKGFRVKAVTPAGRAKVYCVEEPTHRQIVLRHGLRTGNCYVSGTIADSYVDGEGSIMERATQAAATMRMGGGIGYDFSTLRPKGDLIVKLQSRSSGPISFMEIFDAVCRCTSSSGHRRGAQMGVLRIDHPDIFDFIHAKQNEHFLKGFNISIAVTDEFMQAKRDGKPFQLKFGGRVYREVDPNELWDAVMRSTWDWAEPGVLFIDRINEMNNLHYCETIAATNPCGEQPLPPFGACLLGSFNLVRYVSKDMHGWRFDWDRLARDIAPVVRAMDNVVDRARYPLPQQEHEAKSKRRMGLGVTGLANAGEALGLPYGSKGFLDFTRRVLTLVRDEAYRASALLAHEKGAFPLYSPEYLDSKFVKTLPEDIREMIEEHGIRNSHLTSIAPTGTISLCADNISSGLEPVFSYGMERTVIEFEGPRKELIEDYGVRVFGVRGRRSSDVTVAEHVAVLAVAAELVDSAVSKTCNVDSRVSWDEFKRVYDSAWELGCKGITTYRADGKRGGVIVAKDDDTGKAQEEEAASCTIDPETGRRSCE